jgi:transcriptional regulator GlxA family with amidase domain
VSRLLAEAGEARYGPRWQSELARDLDVSIRTMQRWAAGTTDVPAGLYVDLLRLTQERAAVLDALGPRLRKAP